MVLDTPSVAKKRTYFMSVLDSTVYLNPIWRLSMIISTGIQLYFSWICDMDELEQYHNERDHIRRVRTRWI